MPKLSSTLPKYRRHRASGQAIVTISGRDHYLGRFGTNSSRVEYDRLIGEWMSQGRPAQGVAPTLDITVVEVIARYWKFAEGYYRKQGRPTGHGNRILFSCETEQDVFEHVG